MSKNVRPESPACALPATTPPTRAARPPKSRMAAAIHRILASQRARRPAGDAAAEPVEWALRLMS